MSRSLDAGASLVEVLSIATAGTSALQPLFERAQDLMVLGLEPRHAFERAGLPELADRLGEATELGIPLSDSLSSLAQVRRAEAASDFEARLRRAPVMMAIPLSLCLLPSFFLIGFAPLLGSL
jgi:pilus assembly protein TadC